jgi:hypothetical protein
MGCTHSGIFMPYKGEEDVASEGLFEHVIDAVKTARDIAYLIWNAG